jgi:hypothetical protein
MTQPSSRTSRGDTAGTSRLRHSDRVGRPQVMPPISIIGLSPASNARHVRVGRSTPTRSGLRLQAPDASVGRRERAVKLNVLLAQRTRMRRRDAIVASPTARTSRAEPTTGRPHGEHRGPHKSVVVWHVTSVRNPPDHVQLVATRAAASRQLLSGEAGRCRGSPDRPELRRSGEAPTQ